MRHQSSLLMCAGVLCAVLLPAKSESQTPAFVGTWVETGIKWTRPPAELHLNERVAECAVLYFAPNHDFALIYGTVIKAPKSEGISNGDGRVVYLGTWSAKNATLEVRYRLVSRTVEKSDETLPGPLETGELQIRNGTLMFANKRFNRHVRLDEELRSTLQGEQARQSATLPIIPICDLFRQLESHRGERIAVRGEYVSTMEGQWIVGRCQGTFMTDGYRWPVALNFGRPADCPSKNTSVCDGWPPQWPTNPDYMVGGYSNGATTATFVGFLHMKSDYQVICLPNGYYATNGFGHLGGAAAELIVDSVVNPKATPARATNDASTTQSDRCVPSNSPSE